MEIKFFDETVVGLTCTANAESGCAWSGSNSAEARALGRSVAGAVQSVASVTERIGETNHREQRQNCNMKFVISKNDFLEYFEWISNEFTKIN